MDVTSRPPPRSASGIWFPLTLLGVLLLSLPGLVAAGAVFLDQDAGLGGWLQTTLGLSYRFGLPAPALGVFLAVPPLLILLYFLKLKRRPQRVPSTFLWKKSIEDLHVNRLFQWLRENVLLFLQLLAVVALLYALMALRLHGTTSQTSRYIILIDNSASMSATDVEPSRLENARAEAAREIDSRSEGDAGMIVVFNSSAQTWQPFTTDRALLRARLREIPQTSRPTRLNEALRLAESLANPQRSTDDAASRPAGAEAGKERTYDQAEGVPTEVHLFSDGRFPDVTDFALGNLDLRFHPAGKADFVADPGTGRQVLVTRPESTDNLAIVSFVASRGDTTRPAGPPDPAGKKPDRAAADAGRLTAEVAVRNYRLASARVAVRVEARQRGELVFSEQTTVDLPARVRTAADPGGASSLPAEPADSPGEAVATFSIPPAEGAGQVVLTARLVGAADRFAADDEAWLAVGVVRRARVLLVGPRNRFLEAFFDDEAVRAVATLTRLSPDALGTEAYRSPAQDGAFDLVIFDRCAPARPDDMPVANTFFIATPPPPLTWGPGDRVEFPHIRGWKRDHPLLDEVTALYEVGVSEAYRLRGIPARAPRLIETDHDMAVLLTLDRESFTDLVLTFPVVNDKDELMTSWPLQPSFPLFLHNVLRVLGGYTDAVGEDRLQPGETKLLRPDALAREVTVVSPDGSEHPLRRGRRAEFLFGDTDRLGAYEVRWPDGQVRSFGVNLLDPDESQIEPRTVVQIGARRVGAVQERGQPFDVWPWFVLAALSLLLLEWVLYTRRLLP